MLAIVMKLLQKNSSSSSNNNHIRIKMLCENAAKVTQRLQAKHVETFIEHPTVGATDS